MCAATIEGLTGVLVIAAVLVLAAFGTGCTIGGMLAERRRLDADPEPTSEFGREQVR